MLGIQQFFFFGFLFEALVLNPHPPAQNTPVIRQIKIKNECDTRFGNPISGIVTIIK